MAQGMRGISFHNKEIAFCFRMKISAIISVIEIATVKSKFRESGQYFLMIYVGSDIVFLTESGCYDLSHVAP